MLFTYRYFYFYIYSSAFIYKETHRGEKMLKIRKLDCGLRMVIDHIPEMQSVTVGIWVNAGCVDETPENSGI